MKFDCDRTCPLFERVDLCRFQPLFAKLGPVVVNSHTVKVKVEFRDPDALRAAVLAMGGAWLGHGKHTIFSSAATGHGFNLPKWAFPLVLDANGEIHCDDYKGRWGNVADLEALKVQYAAGLVESQAAALGWQTERQGETLIVYCPEGGQLTYTNGQIETTGFTGGACHAAREALGLERLGIIAGDVTNKQEFGQVAARVSLLR